MIIIGRIVGCSRQWCFECRTFRWFANDMIGNFPIVFLGNLIDVGGQFRTNESSSFFYESSSNNLHWNSSLFLYLFLHWIDSIDRNLRKHADRLVQHSRPFREHSFVKLLHVVALHVDIFEYLPDEFLLISAIQPDVSSISMLDSSVHVIWNISDRWQTKTFLILFFTHSAINDGTLLCGWRIL